MVATNGTAQGGLAEIRSLLAREESLRSRARLVGWAFPVLVILLLFVYFYLMYGAVRDIEKDKFFARMELTSVKIWPKLGDELRRVGTSLFPLYSAEVEKALSEPLPGLEDKIEKEVKDLKDNLDRNITENMARALSSLSAQQKAALEKEFPELKGDQKKIEMMVKLVEDASNQWLTTQLSNTLQGYVTAFRDLKDTLDKGFKMGSKEKRQIDAERILTLWIEVMDEKISGEETIIQPPKPAKGK